MTRPITTIIHVPTGEITERELNDEEYAVFLRDQEIDEQRANQIEKEQAVIEE